MKKLLLISLVGALALNLSSTATQAYEGGWHDGGGWHDHDINHFHERDIGYWRGGHWDHRYYNGRDGWWWVVGGQYYFYPAAVYPYPDPYRPPVVVAQPGVNAQYWYCANPSGYYPYVPECAVQWQPVGASASAAPAPQPVVAPQPAPTSQREMDDRQLNAFGAELESIHGAGALKKVKNLQKRVAAFHQTLFEHHYNAMDILNDTEKLENRIQDRKEELEGK
jgi:hypothetical protein